jgi:hypothetical protein
MRAYPTTEITGIAMKKRLGGAARLNLSAGQRPLLFPYLRFPQVHAGNIRRPESSEACARIIRPNPAG